MNHLKEQIIKEAERIEEDSLYSSKGHFNAGEIWEKVHFWIGVPSVLFSAIAGASALNEFNYHIEIAGILSIIVASLTSITTFVNPNKRSITHKTAGNKYNSLKNRARIFYSIEVTASENVAGLTTKLQMLDDERSQLNEESPIIHFWAFNKAKKGILEGESQYQTDDKTIQK